jgi:hypothetical protein
MSSTGFSGNPLIRLWTAPSAPARNRQPLLYSIDEALGVIFIDLLAVDNAPAVIQALQQIRLNPLFRRDLNLCIDCEGLSDSPEAGDVRRIAGLCPRGAMSDLTGLCAIVASSSWASGTARAFAALAGARAHHARVFGACADALLWLGGRQQTV